MNSRTTTAITVLVKFQPPRYWGESMSHISGLGKPWDASMGQKAVTSNPGKNSVEHSRIWLRKEPVSDPSLFRTCEIGLIRMNQKVRGNVGPVLKGSGPVLTA